MLTKLNNILHNSGLVSIMESPYGPGPYKANKIPYDDAGNRS